MKKPIKFAVEVTPPVDTSNWNVRVELINAISGRLGWAESDCVGEAFKEALLVALATEVEPEEHA
jgi:hypothetical protein